MTSKSLSGVLAAWACAVAGVALAQTPPRSFEASPDVYKVVGRNDPSLVIEVTWKPGQRDLQQSAGCAGVQGALAPHAVENIGRSDCRMVMFEPR